jgi:signal transduction histidine kinase
VASLLRTRLDAQVAALDLTAHGIRARNTLNDDTLSTPTDGCSATASRSSAPWACRQRSTESPHHWRSAPSRHLKPAPAISSSPAAPSTSTATLALRRALNAALEPVEQMTASAEEWGANELDTRFHLGPARDEITGLALTLDHLLDRIAASRRHEQRFASEMAHELRTPLAAIQGHAEFAADARSTNEEIRAAINQITTQTARMSQTIDALMAYARHETETPEHGSHLPTVCAEFDGVTVTAADDLPAADAEPALVRQALSPVVENARRHAATRVWIELSRRGGQVTVQVCDDGPGVDPAIAASVFEPGARGPGTNGGAGLGLPLAQRLARSCGGDLRLLPGSPTRFELTLPIRP